MICETVNKDAPKAFPSEGKAQGVDFADMQQQPFGAFYFFGDEKPLPLNGLSCIMEREA